MTNLVILGDHDQETITQIKRVADCRAAVTALLADGHLGEVAPVGTVVAYKESILPAAAGYDIGCGNMAVRTKLKATSILASEWHKIADELYKTISFGIGLKNKDTDAPVDHDIFEDKRWEAIPEPFRESLKTKARLQLGTVGGGNHYVDVLVEPSTQAVWIAVHFGSRGLGWSICSGFNSMAKFMRWDQKSPLTPWPSLTSLSRNQDYLQAMTLAGDYAKIGREWVVNKVLKVMGTEGDFVVHNHHNYIWEEEHLPHGKLWVHRKGATPAWPGQMGFIGSHMCGPAYVVEGKTPVTMPESDFSMQRQLLYSTVHGSGRVMSRTQARGKIKTRIYNICTTKDCKHYNLSINPYLIYKKEVACCPECGKETSTEKSCTVLSAPKVTTAALNNSIREGGIILRGGGVDEAPVCYRDIEDVMKLHKTTVNILHTLEPKVVLMAPADVFDPYKG